MVIKERNRIITEPVINTTPARTPADDRLYRGNGLVRYLVEPSGGLLILRLLLGAVFIMHGSQKVFGWFDGHGLAGTAEMMAKMGTPAILAYLASFTEFFGGLALVFGLLTRMAALGIMCVMSVAIGQVHLSHGFFAPQGFEFPMTLGVIALVIFLLGPGRFSLDALFKRRRWL